MQWLRLNTALLFTPHWRDFSISRLSDFDADAGKEAGLHHMAFTFKSLRELLDTYTRLKESGIRPNWCINHGPTTSMYYRNPDNNQVELLIDYFDDVREGKAYIQSPAFAKNPIGVPFEPEPFVIRLQAGASAAELDRIE